MRTCYSEKFIKSFNYKFSRPSCQMVLSLLNNPLSKNLQSITNAVGLAIPIQYDKLEKDEMK